MVLDKLLDYGFFLIIAGIVIFKVIQMRWKMRSDASAKAKGEALFRSMFPELQPYFHPQKLIPFVLARRTQKGADRRWKGPPGLGVDTAEFLAEAGGRERVRLLDAAGVVLTEFFFEDHYEGAVLRIGKGKLTVNIQRSQHPRVRYWHPEREFKWKNGHWTFQSRLADREIESGDRTSFSSDSSSSPGSSAARGAAAAGGIIAAGGTFDGGGASAAWDGASGESFSHGSGGGGVFEGSTSSATAY